MPTYDELAIDALLDSDKARGQKRIATLTAHAKGEYTCPDCGDQGPHNVQHNGFETEFACSNCGMQHCVPSL